MNIKKSIFILVGVVIIISSGLVIFFNNSNQPVLKETEILKPEIKGEVSLAINDGEKEPQSFKVEFFKGMTAFDLLKEKAKQLGFNLKTKNYDIGVMIIAIGNKENGQGGKYWLYYVNKEMPQIAADKKELKEGDKVEFKFAKSPF